MHLTSLKIKNFRALEDVEVSKLGQVNLIVGKNNSGKSSVLEALLLFAGGFNRHALETVAKNRNETIDNDLISIADLFTEREQSELRVAFSVGDKSNELRAECLKALTPDQSIELSHIKIHTILENNISLDDICISVFSELNRLRPLYSYGYIETQTGDISTLASSFDLLLFNNHENAIICMLQIIEPKIQNIAFLSLDNNFSVQQKRVPYVEIEGIANKVPLISMGEGMLRLLQIIIRLFEAKDGFLLIDEFENGLHYSVQQEAWNLIFELAKRHNIQVFATTHSWDCIENFAEVAKERQNVEGVLFRMGRSVRKSDKGKIIATVFDEDELYTLTKDKIEVR